MKPLVRDFDPGVDGSGRRSVQPWRWDGCTSGSSSARTARGRATATLMTDRHEHQDQALWHIAEIAGDQRPGRILLHHLDDRVISIATLD